ncbi:UvrD-helicase domain-containing protein [Methanorbis rubei]|uniref:DNA 3'-5' helicase n=1 Tax=Methanorbis rubei TaxID=3028300 RepID=A0AAE4MDG9_9EURY|nr:ATP-dependent helicase/nuclease subunit A [Methanocorpusculaceae archaeon Cs1]
MVELTERQREALSMGKSLCVTAGAGTGKTFLLSRRYQMLLSYLREKTGSASVSDILALTFTEKAAAEMRERIEADIRGLAEAAETADEYLFWTEILDEFFRAAITTFHGFCAAILREFALDAGIDPGFEILDEMEKQVLTTISIRNVLMRPPEFLYEDASFLFADVSSLEKIVAELLPQYTEFEKFFPTNAEEKKFCITRWRQLMTDAVREHQKIFFADPSTKKSISELKVFAELYSRVDDTGGKYLRAVRQSLEILCEADEEEFCAAVAALKAANGTKTGKTLGSKGVFGEDLIRFRESFATLKKSCDSFPSGWSYLPSEEDPFTEESVNVIAALGRITREVHARYQREKQQRNALDFEDLIRLAGNLTEKDQVQKVLRKRFSYILVDEVQDTDPAQSAIIWRIVGALDPSNDAIFLVGDPKQSIYAFRNADICEVNAMQERVAVSCKTDPVALDVSFRSTKEILGVVNYLFAKLFANSAEAWDVGYDPISVSPPRVCDTGTVQILETIPDDSAPSALLEARMIAAKIQEIVASGVMVRDGCGLRPAQFGDMAILLETRNTQALIEHALRETGVPYSIYKSQGFYGSQEVVDMMLLLSVITGMGDDIALYGVLRSPYFGISDADLCITGGGSYYGRVIRHAKEHPESRIARAMTQIRRWQNFSMREAVPEFLRRVLREAGMYAVYGGMPGGKFILANLEKLTGLARAQTRKRSLPLPEFVRMLATGAEEEISESEAQIDLPDGNAVRIMTVHASKGLEFPVVILANLDKNTSSPGTGLVLDKTLGIGLSMRMHGAGEKSADTFVRMFTKETRGAKEIAERKRLFYVAMTRAKDHLILSYVKGKSFPQKNSRAQWLSEYLLPAEHAQSFSIFSDETIIEISVTSGTASAADEINTLCCPAAPLGYSYAVREETESPQPRLRLRSASATAMNHARMSEQATPDTIYGIVLHAVFQGQDASMLCRKHRLDAAAEQQIREAYAEFLNSEIMQNAAEEFCELPFSVEIMGKQLTGVIDRLVRYQDGSLRVIDYKSGKMSSAEKETLAQYQRQVFLYAAAVEKLFSVTPSACVYFAHSGEVWEIAVSDEEITRVFGDE